MMVCPDLGPSKAPMSKACSRIKTNHLLKAQAVTTAPTSYLQTLAKDEALAFVAFLQSVKMHLSQEVMWMEAQVQQKKAQLQGIETLLSEAEALRLVTAATHSIPEATSVVAAPVTPAVTATDAIDANGSEISATEHGSTSIVTATEPVAAAIAPLPAKKPLEQPPRQPGKVDSAKVSRDSQPSAAAKTSTTKTKQPKPSTPPGSKVNQRGKASNLQRFLKSQWRDKALTEAVGDILDQAAAPLTTDAVMAALYDGLPQADYDRAKHSLANILSVGRSKGAWKSTGRGLYAGKAVTTAAVGV